MHLNFSDIIAAISLVWTAVTFGRTVRHRPEASWMNAYIVTRLPNATPPLTDEHGRPKARMTCPRMPGSASTGPNHPQDCAAVDTKKYHSRRNSPTNGGKKRTGRHRTDWPNNSAHGAHTEGSTTIPKTPENHRNQPSESP